MLLITREYQRRFPGGFLVQDVAHWAMQERLLPVPGRLTSEAAAVEKWDRLFRKVCDETIEQIRTKNQKIGKL